MFSLRSYQKEVVRNSYALIRQGIKRILIFAPTGAGKTVIATKIVYDAVSRGRKVLFVVHRDILVSQTYAKFFAVGLECGFIKAGWQQNRDAPVQIASVQTLLLRQDWRELNISLILFDECHIIAFHKISQQMMNEIFPQAIYLGLTATPWRLSKKESLGDIYHARVCAPMPGKLIEDGFLAKPSYYSLNFQADLQDIELTDGDYNSYQLSRICDRQELIEQAVNSWYDLAYSRPTIAFTVGVNHARNLVTAFETHGILAASVTGSTPIKERNRLYEQLASGNLKLLASCEALSEGFDVPEVSCVVLSRPTKSKALYFQQLGRGLRLSPQKRGCLVLDQAQNVLEHGFIEDLTEADVELIPSSSTSASDKENKAPLKICPQENGGCGNYVYAVYLKCPHCQFNFDLNRLITVLGNNRLIKPQDEVKLNYYRSLLREAIKCDRAPSWAAMKFKDKYGFFPLYDWARNAIYGGDRNSFSRYETYLKAVALRLNKDRSWVDKYLYLEFGKF